MKKIMSIFCTLAMMLSMAVVAHADEANYTEWKLISKEGGNAVVELHLITNKTLSGCPMFWDFSDAIAKGATGIELTKVEASLSNYITQNGMNCVMFNKTSVDGFSGDIVLGTATVKGISENFEIKLQPTSSKTNTKITDADKAVVTSEFTFATQSIVVKDEPTTFLEAKVDEEIAEVVAPSGKTTYGISGVVSGGALFNTLVLTVNELTNGYTADVDFEIGTAIEANDITFGLNIWGAPADIDFSATAAASLN